MFMRGGIRLANLECSDERLSKFSMLTLFDGQTKFKSNILIIKQNEQ